VTPVRPDCHAVHGCAAWTAARARRDRHTAQPGHRNQWYGLRRICPRSASGCRVHRRREPLQGRWRTGGVRCSSAVAVGLADRDVAHEMPLVATGRAAAQCNRRHTADMLIV
jgi:hypothetical protein